MAATPLTSLRRRRRRQSDGPGWRQRRRRKAVPRAKAIGLSVADGSDKYPPINNNGSSTINASTARPVHNRHPSSLSPSPRGTIRRLTPSCLITGNELADQTITVSTHGMHILSSPTIIEDTRRYERNSLLFAVGFVLHRSVDPRPFWPVLFNLSLTLRDMEVESEFLSNASTRSRVQIVLEDVLISLNSGIGRCHLLLDDANLLGLQLLQPPPPPVPPVPNHAMYDWDLTVNWIVPHIDDCKHVRQIAASTEVDMNMGRPPLVAGGERKAAGGDEDGSAEGNEWLEGAFRYSVKANRVHLAPWAHRGGATWTDGNSPNYGASNMARRLYSHMSSLHSLDLSVGNFSTARRAGRRRFTSEDSNASPRCRDRFPPALKYLVSSGKNVPMAEAEVHVGRQQCLATIVAVITVDAAGKDNISIDWKLAFNYFDHRRLVTFGVVGGFLRRVHQFPLAYVIEADNDEAVTSANRRKESIATNDGDSVNHEDDSSNNSSEPAVAAKQSAMDEMSVPASYSTSPLLQGVVPPSLVKKGKILSNKTAQKEIHLRSKRRLLRRIMLVMDGMRCDDELSCMFEHPIENLVKMLQSTGRTDGI
ncbi:hypothetical protein ACHAW5_006606 [Stephanodiscus triporus]|uniref:Uncharacterized protein n=1 Tax=Stephanodiscus triporus TaxID=2934178 RepID=A0ABD3PJG9_9STRA